MKKKLPIILLSTSLLLGPVTSFADETQAINQKADPKITEVEFKNGDREVNPNKENTKDVKETTDVKEENKEDKETKENSKKVSQPDQKLGEKDVSKTVAKTPLKLEIVDQIDPAYQEANYITITSEGTNKEAITGFSYVLENKTTGEKIDINFKDKNAIIVRGADGKYTLTLKEKPENFKEEKEMTFEMPYITKKNQNGIDESTRLLQIKPKHILKPEVPNKPNPQTSDTKDLNFKIIAPIIVAIIAILGYLAYDKKKKNAK